MFKNNIDRFPKFVLLHLLSYCRDSYKSLRVVCKRFTLLVPMPNYYVKYNEYKILQPKKMLIDISSGRNYPKSLEQIDINFIIDHVIDFDFSHLTNLRKLIGPGLDRINISIKVPNNLEVLKYCYYCDLSNTKLVKLHCRNREILETAPITLEILRTDKLYPFCNKFVNLETLLLHNANKFDYTCFTKLKIIYMDFNKPYKLPLSIEHITVRSKKCDLDFTYLPNLKVVRATNCQKNITVNAGVKII